MENEIELVNVDESNNILENVDWSVYKRIRVDEEIDQNGQLVRLISRCELISQEELNEQALKRAHEYLKNTDYVAAKTMDALLGCNSLESIQDVMSELQTEYSDILAQRQTCREQINQINGEE